ncbi:hypothetical protein V6617_02080 [Pelagibacterium nitratireducens]|uniref:SMODS-associating 2TM beta-strand rich effector domain-containing protein n=1 Tax=Pelagibacterium nitratireducens TaxID=1046114 RepID=A0ABZ2I3Z6_9HYPH
MLQWFVEYSDAINAASGVAMLFVWMAYLQVFLRSYSRQVRPKIVINRAGGSALDAHCFVSNMSSEAMYLESVIVTVRSGEQVATHTVTDIVPLDGDKSPVDPRERTHQGPLRPGEYTSVGTFDEILDKVIRQSEDPQIFSESRDPVVLEVMIIADYSSEDLLVGAKRRFKAEWRGETWYLGAESAETRQIRSRRERRKIRDIVANQG